MLQTATLAARETARARRRASLLSKTALRLHSGQDPGGASSVVVISAAKLFKGGEPAKGVSPHTGLRDDASCPTWCVPLLATGLRSGAPGKKTEAD